MRGGKRSPKLAALHLPGLALLVQFQLGARRIHPRTFGARIKLAGHEAPKIIQPQGPSLLPESGEGGGMGREGGGGCQECVRAAADKSGAGTLGWDLFCFRLMLIGVTWCMDIRRPGGPLPRWLHPREGDILPTAVGGREGNGGGWEAVKTSKQRVQRGPSSPKLGIRSQRPPWAKEMNPMSCWYPRVVVDLDGDM